MAAVVVVVGAGESEWPNMNGATGNKKKKIKISPGFAPQPPNKKMSGATTGLL